MNKQVATYDAVAVQAPKGMITESAATLIVSTVEGHVTVNMPREAFEQFLDGLPRRSSASSAKRK